MKNIGVNMYLIAGIVNQIDLSTKISRPRSTNIE